MSETEFEAEDEGLQGDGYPGNYEDDDLDDLDDLDDGDDGDDGDDVNTIEVPTARNVLEYLVKSVVEHPDEVDVEIVERRGAITLEVTVADGDMGRVIGRRGRVANSIRTIVRAAASKDGSAVDVEFVD